MLSRLFVNMNVLVEMVLVCSAAIRSAYTYALRILGYPCRRAMILTCNNPLKTGSYDIASSFSIWWCE